MLPKEATDLIIVSSGNTEGSCYLIEIRTKTEGSYFPTEIPNLVLDAGEGTDIQTEIAHLVLDAAEGIYSFKNEIPKEVIFNWVAWFFFQKTIYIIQKEIPKEMIFKGNTKGSWFFQKTIYII